MLYSPFWHDILAEENFDQCQLVSLAFDEAHTLVSYPDFRAKYHFIPELINNLNPDLSIHLLTATCSPETLKHLCNITGLQDNQITKVAVIADRYHNHNFVTSSIIAYMN